MALTTIQAAMSGVPFDLQPAGSITGNGNVLAIPNSFRNHQFLITGAGTVTTGAVTIETSNDPNDAGLWAAIDPNEAIVNPVTILSATDLLISYFGILFVLDSQLLLQVAGQQEFSILVVRIIRELS
jgi:hypothetical protein